MNNTPVQRFRIKEKQEATSIEFASITEGETLAYRAFIADEVIAYSQITATSDYCETVRDIARRLLWDFSGSKITVDAYRPARNWENDLYLGSFELLKNPEASK